MTTVHLSLDEVHRLATEKLIAHGCDDQNAAAVADTITTAERDLAHSHGLFRLPGYVKSLKSGKVNGKARATAERLAPSAIRVDGDGGFAPPALQCGYDPLAEAARETGIAALAIVDIYHFAALWPEVTALAERGLVGFAFTAAFPYVAPAGGIKPLFGTNPMAFAWPRRDKPPMVFDQASSAMARGEVMIAAREKHSVPDGVGIAPDGMPTRDPEEILKGAQLAFGGYKGASLALMIELLAGPLIGEHLSFEAKEVDNGDGGPPVGGEFLIAIDPARFGDPEKSLNHAEKLFERLLSEDGTRLPGDRRYTNRSITPEKGIEVPQSLYDQIMALD